MRNFQIKIPKSSSIQLYDENEKLVGEILTNLILGLKEKIKIEDKIFRIKSNGFIGIDIKVFDEKETLIIESHTSKNRLIYFGDIKEIYTYKNEKWFDNKVNLFKEEKLAMSIKVLGTFKSAYEIEVAKDFSNSLVILTFLNFYNRLSGA